MGVSPLCDNGVPVVGRAPLKRFGAHNNGEPLSQLLAVPTVQESSGN
jgi:hypothetical protein